jgi:hypothetical protein
MDSPDSRSPFALPNHFKRQLRQEFNNYFPSALTLGGVSSRASGDKAAYSGIRAVQERAGQRPALCARVGVVLRVLDNHRFLVVLRALISDLNFRPLIALFGRSWVGLLAEGEKLGSNLLRYASVEKVSQTYAVPASEIQGGG